MMKAIFVLSVVCLAIISNGCRNVKYESNVKPEDEYVWLNKYGESPIGKEQDYKIGDNAAFIREDGSFKTDGTISETCEKLILVEVESRTGRKEWMPYATARNVGIPEKIVPKGYKISYSGVRRSYSEWFPPAQIFPVPWANNVKLNVGDTVYEKSRRNYEPRKGIITELPKPPFYYFYVRFDDSPSYNSPTAMKSQDVFSSIEPAKPEDLSPGVIVYYDKWKWAIVTGVNGDKITVRPEGSWDGIVHISKLQILK